MDMMIVSVNMEGDEEDQDKFVSIPDGMALDQQDDVGRDDSYDWEGRDEGDELLAGVRVPVAKVRPQLRSGVSRLISRVEIMLTSIAAWMRPV